MSKYVYQLNKIEIDSFSKKKHVTTLGIFSTEIHAENFAYDNQGVGLPFSTPEHRTRNYQTETPWINGKANDYAYMYKIEQFIINPGIPD